VRPDVERFDGKTVHFKDGSCRDYDLVIAATGYRLHFPFIKAEALNWHGMAPRLYLNIFPPHYRRLAVLGMVEASGLGWQGRYEQAELVAAYLKAQDKASPAAAAFEAKVRGPLPDMSGGYRYLKLERMAYYVHKETYRSALRAAAKELTA
jgi:Flavin-binding monooxygenase-like